MLPSPYCEGVRAAGVESDEMGGGGASGRGGTYESAGGHAGREHEGVGTVLGWGLGQLGSGEAGHGLAYRWNECAMRRHGHRGLSERGDPTMRRKLGYPRSSSEILQD